MGSEPPPKHGGAPRRPGPPDVRRTFLCLRRMLVVVTGLSLRFKLEINSVVKVFSSSFEKKLSVFFVLSLHFVYIFDILDTFGV